MLFLQMLVRVSLNIYFISIFFLGGIAVFFPFFPKEETKMECVNSLFTTLEI
jgi:hypothetical protein